jgi:hypothetical protein
MNYIEELEQFIEEKSRNVGRDCALEAIENHKQAIERAELAIEQITAYAVENGYITEEASVSEEEVASDNAVAVESEEVIEAEEIQPETNEVIV